MNPTFVWTCEKYQCGTTKYCCVITLHFQLKVYIILHLLYSSYILFSKLYNIDYTIYLNFNQTFVLFFVNRCLYIVSILELEC